MNGRTDTINKYNEPLFKLVLWFVLGRESIRITLIDIYILAMLIVAFLKELKNNFKAISNYEQKHLNSYYTNLQHIHLQASFSASSSSFSSTIDNNGYTGMSGQVISTVEIVGLTAASISTVLVNGAGTTDFIYNNGRLTISSQSIPIDTAFTITYN